MSIDSQITALDEKATALLACPDCHAPRPPASDTQRCTSCGSVLSIKDGVVVARDLSSHSYFDSTFEVMRLGNKEEGTWELFYRRQVELVSAALQEGGIVVDVGCGPELPYRKGDAFVIGVDASFDSIRMNAAVDLRVFASAAKLPLRSGCIDTVMCFYSLHHMTGETVGENRSIASQVFLEFVRVLKPGGRLMVFDVSPRWPFGALEDVTWDMARRSLGSSLDMYFWQRADLERLGGKTLNGASLNIVRFDGSSMTTFSPIFSKPGLRLPRLFYPFDICLYDWRMAG